MKESRASKHNIRNQAIVSEIDARLGNSMELQRQYEELAPETRYTIDIIAARLSDGDLGEKGRITRALLVARMVTPEQVDHTEALLREIEDIFIDTAPQ